MVDVLHNSKVLRHLEKMSLSEKEEPTDGCCICHGEETLLIGGQLYCDSCATEEFRVYDEAECEVCGEESDEVYRVGNEYYCEDCFLEIHSI